MFVKKLDLGGINVKERLQQLAQEASEKFKRQQI